MSVRAMAYMKELHICPNGEMVTRTEKFVGMVLADSHQDKANRRTFPDVRTVADDAMVSERQCQRVLASLERKGVIRREYPAGPGRGKTTYYFFPELDESKAVSAVNKPVEMPSKGCHGDTLIFGERVTEGCHKGDISRTPIDNREQVQQEQVHPPYPPPGESEFSLPPLLLHEAADGVMRACGWTDRRIRHAVLAQLRLASMQGEALPMIAARMITAWTEHMEASADGLLRGAPYGPKKFIGLGKWNDSDSWHWDQDKLAMQSRARVGMRA